MSAIGTKRTWPSALHMSAFDPKRTSSCGSAVRAETKSELKGKEKAPTQPGK
jgi:hypothetical protein